MDPDERFFRHLAYTITYAIITAFLTIFVGWLIQSMFCEVENLVWITSWILACVYTGVCMAILHIKSTEDKK